MYCVDTASIIEYTIKKSRFIGLLIPCQDINTALQEIDQLHHQHPHANHIVFAYRIKTKQGIISRFHDAGEPSGTAGKPVYQHLEGKNLINILIIVVRYFGGIKLGAGGLTRAYSNTAKKTIEASIITEHIEHVEVKLEIDYKQMRLLEYKLNQLDGKILQQTFSENICLVISLPQKNQPTLAATFEL